MHETKKSVPVVAGMALLQALPVAVYTTDAEGLINFYNDAAAEFWGYRPELGSARWCGSWRLFWPDGRPMAHDECPMAVALKEGRVIRGVEAIAERPDGTRVTFMPSPTPLKDDAGRLIGGINLLVDITERKQAEIAAAKLAAIVSSSDDAIISKDLDGTITSWNGGASRIFGYEADDMVGRSIRQIIPAELQQEDDEILARLRRGERIEHFDTVRLTKDGERIDVSLTISPMHDSAGRVIGASKVARDVTERKRNEELQHLLFEELNHRVKNTLAMIQALANQSMRAAASPSEFVTSFGGRVQALARAHDLLVRQRMQGASVEELVREQVVLGGGDEIKVRYSGPDIMLDARTAVQLALVLHELATNARKYGALSRPAGALSVTWSTHLRHGDNAMQLRWQESGVPNVAAPRSRGFGTTLIERSLEAQQGEASLSFGPDGLTCDIRLPLPKEIRHEVPAAIAGGRDEFRARAAPAPDRPGRRILLVEDEPLVAMQLEEELTSAEFDVVGPASHVQSARRLIAQAAFDAALLDANLGGHPVDELAASLAQNGVPFAFATGYGREALPAAFRDAPMVSKPFNANHVVAVVRDLLDGGRHSARVVSLRSRKG